MHDFTLAWRQLRATPVFTGIAILSLALGIGANTAVFTIVNEFLLRSLPVRDAHQLVLFRAIHGAGGRMSRRGEGPGFIDPATGRSSGTAFPLLAFERFRTQRSALSDVFAYSPFSQVNVLIAGNPDPTVSAQFVSGNYHAALGVAAALGRMLTLEDDQRSAPPVAVISHRFWQNRFDADPEVLGTTIAINTVATTIVGVSAPLFEGALQAGEVVDVSVPLAHHALFQPDRAERAQPWYWWVRIMGRLAPGATAAQARASLEPIFQEAAREGWRARQQLEPAGVMPDAPTLAADPGAQGENDLRRQYARSLLILQGLAGLVLIAACLNVANLLVARGSARRRDIALRLALGASRTRIVRQLLAESVLLAAAGAAAGVVLAWSAGDALLALRPFGNTTVVLNLSLDTNALAFTFVCAAITVMVFGVAPALSATRVDLTADFHSGGRALGRSGGSRLSRALLTAQVALSLVLLVSTGLFLRSLGHLQAVDAGYNIHNLTLFRIDAASAGYAREEFVRLHAQIQERLQAVPGVRAVTFSRVAPLSRTRQNMNVSIPGYTPAPGTSMNVNTNGVAANFFAAMELPLVLGRGFDERDHAGAQRVAVVNQTFARTYFRGDDPIGREIVFSAPDFNHRVAIVGVSGDAKYTDLRSAVPSTVYFPALQQPEGNANFAVRHGSTEARRGGTKAMHAAMFAAIRAVVREIDPTLPVLNLRTQAEQIDRLHGQERLFAWLSAFFGVTALALACVGLYGLMSHAVVRRSGEIGLRMALGAPPARMLRMFLGESLLLVCCGVALGFAAAYGASRLVAAMLFGVSRTDPLTYGSVALILIATALLATGVPAYRASRIDPLTTLRSE